LHERIAVRSVTNGSARPHLTAVPTIERRRLLGLARQGISHTEAAAHLPILSEIMLTPPPVSHAMPEAIRIGAWNLQHCHWWSQSASLLAAAQVDIALLTELDFGMHRTGQIDTPRALAESLGYGYGFAVEFVELVAPGGDGDSRTALENRDGFHGNGFAAPWSPIEVGLVRLAPEADWFHAPRRSQHRIGGRVAVMAAFSWGTEGLIVVSVHLESDTDAAGRARQMRDLLTAIDSFAAGRPIVIGGDFNAGALHPTLDYRAEPLFAAAGEFGYDWASCNAEGVTSRISRVTNALSQDRAHYDWFFTRGLLAEDPRIVAAVDDEGAALSDHELITVLVRPKGQVFP
jgi:endonuclease/exonuclease/phosphatase family metal-dependent hydrolase